MRTSNVVRHLIRPVYVPSFVYSVGVGAAAPAVVLVAVSLDLATPAIALLVAAAAAVSVVGTAAAGQFVARAGERRALVGATAVSTVVLLALCTGMWAHSPGQRAVFVVAVTVGAAVDGVWSVARQAVLAETVPPSARGRAITTYAAVQRAGRACGPLIGAAAIVFLGPAAGFAVHGATGVVACALLVRHLPRGATAPGRIGSRPGATRVRLSSFWVLGSSMLVLDLVRTNKDLLVATAGLSDAGLGPAQVSLAASVGLWFELVLFWPAGKASDRFGPSGVAAASLSAMAVGLLVLAAPGAGPFMVAVVMLGLGNGIGAGMIKTIGVTIAPKTSPAPFLGRWTAYTGLGSLIGPLTLAVAATTAGGASATALLAAGAAGVLARSGSRLIRSAKLSETQGP